MPLPTGNQVALIHACFHALTWSAKKEQFSVQMLVYGVCAAANPDELQWQQTQQQQVTRRNTGNTAANAPSTAMAATCM